MDPARILVQLDSDSHASVFDAVVAIDAGVDHLLQYANVESTNVKGLVHGAMFTRGPAELNRTAIFIGGSSVSRGESIMQEVCQTFFGPVRCSVMFDGNGSNTTAAAAVLCAARHERLDGSVAIVLGGTGPVGQRVARMLLSRGGRVHLASRDRQKAMQVVEQLSKHVAGDRLSGLTALSLEDEAAFQSAMAESNLLFGCGAAGIPLLSAEALSAAGRLRVAIDLNAVPPVGLEGIGVMDKAEARGNRFDYGAIGVGGLKMKIHREAVRRLFTRNDLVLDAEAILEIGQSIEQSRPA